MWRGQQYDRAIQLYRKKNAAPGPPNLDALIQGRFLRKKFKDPITNDDFALIGVNAAAPAGPGATQAAQPAIGFGQLIGGVRSKSKARSFKEPDGATTYDAWTFSYVAWKSPNQATGAPGGGPGAVVGVGQGTGGAGGFGRGGFGSGGQGTGRRGPGDGRPPRQGRPPGEPRPTEPGPGPRQSAAAGDHREPAAVGAIARARPSPRRARAAAASRDRRSDPRDALGARGLSAARRRRPSADRSTATRR